MCVCVCVCVCVYVYVCVSLLRETELLLLNESMSVMLDESRSVFPCMHAALTRMCHVRGARTDKCFIPALFAHADGDDFVLAHHSKHLYERYSGDKNIITFGGDHNSPRPAFFFVRTFVACCKHVCCV